MEKTCFMKMFGLMLILLITAGITLTMAEGGCVSFSSHDGIPLMRSSVIDGVETLFLPSFASPDQLRYSIDDHGEAVLTLSRPAAPLSAAGAVLTAEDGCTLSVQLVQSADVRTLFLISDDPVEHGIAFVEAEGQKHENKASGAMVLVDQNGNVDHEGEIKELRGRGNATWLNEKKPYQIKLKKKADLLGTGKAKKFCLLTAAQDPSMLRNRIWLDLGWELGLTETPATEPVALYYDGEYRGAYILTGKVEIGEGSIRGSDWEDVFGVPEEPLPAQEGTTGEGKRMSFTPGAPEAEDVHAATWYMELDNVANITDPCWFELEGVRYVSMKVPEFASESMMRYASGLMEKLIRTLENRGTDPVSGEKLETQIDMEAYAALVLLNEIGSCYDGMTNGNAYFIMHEGENVLSPGPVWDMDLICSADPAAVRENQGWLQRFYRVPAMRAILKKLYTGEMLPLLENVLFGQEHAGRLKPIGEYADGISASWFANSIRWGQESDLASETAALRSWLKTRLPWFSALIDSWREDADLVDVYATACYTQTESTFRTGIMGWSAAVMDSFSIEQLTEADEESYARWQFDCVIRPDEGYAFSEPVVRINEAVVPAGLQEDGTLLVHAVFEDASYRPVDYDGQDIGYIYDEAAFRKNYPALDERFRDDPEGLMAYFMEEGIYEGLQGNAYFSGRRADYYMNMQELFWGAWEEYYFQFMEYGYDDWMQSMPVSYRPAFFAE